MQPATARTFASKRQTTQPHRTSNGNRSSPRSVSGGSCSRVSMSRSGRSSGSNLRPLE